MSANWSDFLATPPPDLASTSPGRPLSEYVDSSVPPSQDFIIAQEQYTEIFSPPQPAAAPPPGHPQMAPPHAYNGPQFIGQFNDFNEIENRALLVTNVSPQTTKEEIEKAFNLYPEIRNIDLSSLSQGTFTVEYFDLRHAQNVKRITNGSTLHGRVIVVSYAPLPKIEDPKKPPNNGTIVVFHLPPDITATEIQSVFGRYGEIKQVRGTPAKPTQRFIEYWDIRAAENALNGLSGKFVQDSKVSIEFSLPGGFRRNVQRGEQGGGSGQVRIHHG